MDFFSYLKQNSIEFYSLAESMKLVLKLIFPPIPTQFLHIILPKRVSSPFKTKSVFLLRVTFFGIQLLFSI